LVADVWAEAILHAARWMWALMQWQAYHGPYLTVAIWAVFVVLRAGRKVHRALRKTGSPPLTVRESLGAMCQSLGRPALALSALAVLLYLAIAPNVVIFVEHEVQTTMAFARRPAAYWEEVDQAVQQVRSDRSLMPQLEQAVTAEMSEAPDSE
jgi:hypothetical protein